MARKTVSIKAKRAEAEAAEKATPKKKKAAPKAKRKSRKKEAAPKAKRKSRKKEAAEIRLKAFWGVFNQSLKRVALYEYSQKRQAEKKAGELTDKHNSPHFVQPVKEVIEEK